MNIPANLDLSPELRSLIEESVQIFTTQLKAGTGAFYTMIDSKGWIEQYRTEVTRVIRRTGILERRRLGASNL
jgi:hypothetical protein